MIAVRCLTRPRTVESGERYICRYKANPLEAVTESLPDNIKELFAAVVKQYESNADEAPKLSVAFLEMMKTLSQAIYTVTAIPFPRNIECTTNFFLDWP